MNYHIPVFEIALVRLSETSDYLHGQVNNPLAVIRWPSEKKKIFFFFFFPEHCLSQAIQIDVC